MERWRLLSSKCSPEKLANINKDEYVLDVIPSVSENEGGLWNMQLFRSITSDSCKFDDSDTDGISNPSKLHSKGGRSVERSIQECMVRQIRKAERYIYMENQYFLGSAYNWKGNCDTLAHHLIPFEMTRRIIEKIEAGQPFKCYIVIPMYPEGDPATAALQEILFWQHRTMELMYRKISKAIEAKKAETHPTDYLSFYCLAKRESPSEVPMDLKEPEQDSIAATLRKTMRYPIYVHCKMSIFDDEYILIGSANVNQRSLGGNRDTEIAVGGYQPGEKQSKGDVRSFRMALWAAHLGGTDKKHEKPESDKCLGKVKETTKKFWALYTAEKPEHSDVKMLPYPINVDKKGKVTALEKPWNCFPDTQASVIGATTGEFDMAPKITT